MKTIVKLCQLLGIYAPLRRVYYNLRYILRRLISGKMRVRDFVLFFTKRREFCDKLATISYGKRVIIFPPTLDWNIPLFQRPHQLAVAYSKMPDTLVLFMTVNREQDDVLVYEEVSDSLWIIQSIVARAASLNISSSAERIVTFSWTKNSHYIEIFKANKFIYEYLDELEIHPGYNKEMIEEHEKLLQTADLVVCTADNLYSKAREMAKHAILSTNGVDYDFFSNTQNAVPDASVKQKVSGYDVVIGYYGALARWFDYDIVAEVAENNSTWCFLLIGHQFDETYKNSRLPGIQNVIYIPAVPYKRLPEFLKVFDVATIPFLVNDITLSTSPVKLFEYMASQKPIISVKIPECEKYDSVFTYTTRIEFENIIRTIVDMSPDDMNKYKKLLKEDALRNTWHSKAKEIISNL